jgi:hypothetical protein
VDQHPSPNDKLYSNLPNTRLLASLEVKDDGTAKKIEKIKPYFWFGSGNAWLVFLGSSPGGSPPKGKEDKSNYKSEILFSTPSNHFEHTKDGAGFWGKIVEYTKTFFPDIEGNSLFRLILAGNLVDTPAGDSRKLDKAELKMGAVESFGAISIVRPKVLICLQRDVYDLILPLARTNSEEVHNNDFLKINSGTKKDVNYNVPVNYFNSTDKLWGKWILTRIPMHPSRPTFCKDENLKEQFLQPLRVMADKYFNF